MSVLALIFVALQGVFEGFQTAMLAGILKVLNPQPVEGVVPPVDVHAF
ncbi:MAG: hypothetical protein MJ195_00900 [Mycoplasmoidaceae bacterium]|nr:hypothetical protein [Mycoplasmoidaceae bacterium]